MRHRGSRKRGTTEAENEQFDFLTVLEALAGETDFHSVTLVQCHLYATVVPPLQLPILSGFI
jgi:hypothetical protein